MTYFPKNKLAFGILFGCTEEIERKVLNRIANIRDLAPHPLLLPGIFAELERERMAEVVESTVDEIEGAIFELDTGKVARESAADRDYIGGERHARRTVWLNTTFLRNRLQIWKTQLVKMVKHTGELHNAGSCSCGEWPEVGSRDGIRPRTSWDGSSFDSTGQLIEGRLRILIEEFGEMAEECTMRIDGMTIATQWVRTKRVRDFES